MNLLSSLGRRRRVRKQNRGEEEQAKLTEGISSVLGTKGAEFQGESAQWFKCGGEA